MFVVVKVEPINFKKEGGPRAREKEIKNSIDTCLGQEVYSCEILFIEYAKQV